MQLFVEWTRKVDQRCGRMVSKDTLPDILTRQDPGFRSVYEFDAEAAQAIVKTQSSKGLGKFPVFSDTLFVDLDHGDRGVTQIEERLDGMGARFEKYESGGKGVHFEIAIQPMQGRDVPYSQYAFAKVELSDLVDSSIYRPSSLIALPGRLHATTGRPKRLLRCAEGGGLLNLPVVQTPPVHRSEVPLRALTPDAWRFAFNKAAKMFHTPPAVGERQLRLWSLAATFKDAGFSFNTAQELLTGVGLMLGKGSHDILRALEDAYDEG